MERVLRRDVRWGVGAREYFPISLFFILRRASAATVHDPLRVRSLTILREKIKEVKKNRKRVCII